MCRETVQLSAANTRPNQSLCHQYFTVGDLISAWIKILRKISEGKALCSPFDSVSNERVSTDKFFCVLNDRLKTSLGKALNALFFMRSKRRVL